MKSNTEEQKPIRFFYYYTDRSHYCINIMPIRVKSKQYIGKWKYDDLYHEDIVYNQKSYGKKRLAGLECAYLNFLLKLCPS